MVRKRASKYNWTDILASVLMHVFRCETGRLLLPTVSTAVSTCVILLTLGRFDTCVNWINRCYDLIGWSLKSKAVVGEITYVRP